MPDTDAILTRLGLDPASMRDGDLEVRTPITGEPIARLATVDARPTSTPRSHGPRPRSRSGAQVPAPRRGELVRLLGEELRREKDALGALVTLEAGKIVPGGPRRGAGDDRHLRLRASASRASSTGSPSRPSGRGTACSRRGTRSARSASSRRSTSRWRCGAGTPRWRWPAATRWSGSRRRSRRSPRSPAGRIFERAARAVRRRPGRPLEVVDRRRRRARQLVDDPRLPLVSATGSTAMGRTSRPRIAAPARPRSCSSSAATTR